MRSPPRPERENPELLQQDGVSDGIEALPSKVNRYGKAKKTALDVAQYIGGSDMAQRLAKQQERLQGCGDYLVFRHFFTVDQVKLHAASLCMQHLLCPLCAIRRGAKALKAYLDRWELIRVDHPNLRPFLITLTVKDGPDLAERFAHLHRGQRELWKRRQRRRGSPLDCVAGAVWSYEVKRGKGSGEWHPHLHMIALAETEPDQDWISREWHQITGDSFVVDVRPISPDDPVSGFIEVFKYAVKFSAQEPADTVAAYLTLKGKRLMASAGCFRDVEVPEGLLDESEALKGLPYVDLFYRFLPGKGYTLRDVKKREPTQLELRRPPNQNQLQGVEDGCERLYDDGRRQPGGRSLEEPFRTTGRSAIPDLDVFDCPRPLHGVLGLSGRGCDVSAGGLHRYRGDHAEQIRPKDAGPAHGSLWLSPP